MPKVINLENYEPPLHKYKDKGCSVAPACLECPLPTCRFDDPQTRRKIEQRTLDEERTAFYWEAVAKHGVPTAQKKMKEQYRLGQRGISHLLARTKE